MAFLYKKLQFETCFDEKKIAIAILWPLKYFLISIFVHKNSDANPTYFPFASADDASKIPHPLIILFCAEAQPHQGSIKQVSFVKRAQEFRVRVLTRKSRILSDLVLWYFSKRKLYQFTFHLLKEERALTVKKVDCKTNRLLSAWGELISET